MVVMTLALIISSIYSINAFIVDFVIMHAGTGKRDEFGFYACTVKWAPWCRFQVFH